MSEVGDVGHRWFYSIFYFSDTALNRTRRLKVEGKAPNRSGGAHPSPVKPRCPLAVQHAQFGLSVWALLL